MHFKGNPESVPDFLRSQTFIDALAHRGVELVLDCPSKTDGSDQRWHDFSDCDIALCIRAERRGESWTNKPATRLINAWSAGCVPLVAAEPAYLELVDDGRDALVVFGPESILEAVDRLKKDLVALKELEELVLARRDQYDSRQILEDWIALLYGTNWERPSIHRTVCNALLPLPRALGRWAFLHLYLMRDAVRRRPLAQVSTGGPSEGRSGARFAKRRSARTPDPPGTS
jgi:hypothetical protein